MVKAVLSALLTNHPNWISENGVEGDVVISSRIRLARNIEGFPFQSKLTPKKRTQLLGQIKNILSKSVSFNNFLWFPADELNEIDQQFLLERHLVSKEYVADKDDRAVLIAPNESKSLMFLEEDHIRLQTFESGLALKKAWKEANRIDNEIQKLVMISFDSAFGYLTGCPTNVGTGLRASCMLHLPSLVLTKQVQKVLQALSKLNLAVRGLYGEGTQALGNYFQFSNQITLGQTEEELIDNLQSVIEQVVKHERDARAHLKKSKSLQIEDQVWRAMGTLKSARFLSSSDAINLLSIVQLGVDLGFFGKQLTHKGLNQLFMLIQPGHIQKTRDVEVSSHERDIFRADLIRKHFLKIRL